MKKSKRDRLKKLKEEMADLGIPEPNIPDPSIPDPGIPEPKVDMEDEEEEEEKPEPQQLKQKPLTNEEIRGHLIVLYGRISNIESTLFRSRV